MPRNALSWLIAAGCLLTLGSQAVAQSTGFTYQGKLTDAGSPATGIYDLQFRLSDTPIFGNQVGPTLVREDVTVSNGIFTVTLDMGADAFSGADRWLEIGVRPGASTGAFSVLSPLQAFSATPYAIRSLNATTADALSLACVNCVSGAQIASLPPNNGNYIQNATSLQSNSNFNVSGNGTLGGTLSAGAVNTSQYNAGGNRILGNPGTNNLFAGMNAGAVNAGSDNAFFGSNAGLNNTANENSFFGSNSGQATTSAGQNAFFGVQSGASNSTGCCNSFFGNHAGELNTTGFANVFIGGSAGGKHTSGARNTLIGDLAGDDLFEGTALVDGTRNTFVGSASGRRIATGSNNTFVGVDTTGTDAIQFASALGSNALVTTDDTIVLGKVAGTYYGVARPADTVQIPGIASLGLPGSTYAYLVDGASPGPYPTIGFNTYGTSYNAGVNGYGAVLQFQDGDGSLVYYTGSSAAAGTAHTFAPRMVLLQNGRLGIGTTGPDQLLTVNGVASKPGGGSWATFSDERLKTVHGSFDRGLAAVMQLEPIRYEYKTNNELSINSTGEHIGFSAQAVERIIPEAVTKNEDGYLLVNNDPIMWAMLNALKEQQSQIEAQRQQIKQQGTELESLKRVICLEHANEDFCKAASVHSK
jgi:Chaperone of endosialidase